MKTVFTVVICDESIIKDCEEKYRIYLEPLLRNEDYAFCKWNIYGESLEEALPDLKELIAKKRKWRAVMIADKNVIGNTNINKRNPFNFVGATKTPYTFGSTEEIAQFRAEKEVRFENAYENPIMRLAAWFAGSPLRNSPNPDSLRGIPVIKTDNMPIIGEDGEAAEENEAQFGGAPALGTPAYEAWFEANPIDVSEYEAMRIDSVKYDFLKSKGFERDSVLTTPPEQIIAIAERTTLTVDQATSSIWKKHSEHDYSRFYEDNLYPNKLRYLIFDIPYITGKRNETVYFEFLSFILTFAANECPIDAIKPNRVFFIDAKADTERIGKLCGDYNGKLYATLKYIHLEQRKSKRKSTEPLTNKRASELFESNIIIPVDVDREYDREELMAQYDEIGLSKDCPSDERGYWKSQYSRIEKQFLRYLREPRRAVKSAATGSFRKNNTIDDERILQMTEYQTEDVVYRLQEEELNMVRTKTQQLYNTAEFTERLEEADKELERAISHRMTRRKTIIIGAVSVAAFLIGFLPLIFGNLNTVKSSTVALIVTLIAVAVFAGFAVLYLFVLRKRLINVFKHFNYTMSGILGEIEAGLNSFSRYLSHACNVMREFSVLRGVESSTSTNQKILRKHEMDVINKIEEVNRLFAGYIEDNGDYSEYEPYAYDFSVLKAYQYDMPYPKIESTIEFIEPGNMIELPLDYLKSVLLVREELYD